MYVSKGEHSFETHKHSLRYGENRKTSIVFNSVQLDFVIEQGLQNLGISKRQQPKHLLSYEMV